MSTHDKKLIQEALDTHPSDWPYVAHLMKEAESEEAREELRSLANYYLHKEEFDLRAL